MKTKLHANNIINKEFPESEIDENDETNASGSLYSNSLTDQYSLNIIRNILNKEKYIHHFSLEVLIKVIKGAELVECSDILLHLINNNDNELSNGIFHNMDISDSTKSTSQYIFA